LRREFQHLSIPLLRVGADKSLVASTSSPVIRDEMLKPILKLLASLTTAHILWSENVPQPEDGE
jgi:hypothetical protein